MYLFTYIYIYHVCVYITLISHKFESGSPCSQGALSLQNARHLLRQFRGGRHQDAAWFFETREAVLALGIDGKKTWRKPPVIMEKSWTILEESSSYLQVFPWIIGLRWPKVPHKIWVALDVFLRIGDSWFNQNVWKLWSGHIWWLTTGVGSHGKPRIWTTHISIRKMRWHVQHHVRRHMAICFDMQNFEYVLEAARTWHHIPSHEHLRLL